MSEDGARLESMLAAYHEMRRKLKETQAAIQSTTVTAESQDGLVRATVGQGIELLHLWIEPDRYRNVDSETLAKTITSTIAKARQRYGVETADQYRSVLGSSFDTDQLASGDEENAVDQIRKTAQHLFGS